MESWMWERVPQMHHLFEKEEIHVIVNITFFWIVTPCNLVGVYQNFKKTCHLHLKVEKCWFQSTKLYHSTPQNIILISNW
jgi:hypothetical protein